MSYTTLFVSRPRAKRLDLQIFYQQYATGDIQFALPSTIPIPNGQYLITALVEETLSNQSTNSYIYLYINNQLAGQMNSPPCSQFPCRPRFSIETLANPGDAIRIVISGDNPFARVLYQSIGTVYSGYSDLAVAVYDSFMFQLPSDTPNQNFIIPQGAFGLGHLGVPDSIIPLDPSIRSGSLKLQPVLGPSIAYRQSLLKINLLGGLGTMAYQSVYKMPFITNILWAE